MNNKCIYMPERLTAENGAKSQLIGEFLQLITHPCDCGGEDEECECCEGTGEYKECVIISWDTIKRIYEKTVQLVKDGKIECTTKQ